VVNSYSGTIDKLIYFILDEDDFFICFPHYIIYGSELMLSLAQNVDEGLKYYLRAVGIPTIFECDIPMQMISEMELRPIYECISTAKGSFDQIISQVFSNYSIIVSSGLEGKYITSHKHPTDLIYDFHAQEHYQNTLETCPACKNHSSQVNYEL
jgi:hypothetical protein